MKEPIPYKIIFKTNLSGFYHRNILRGAIVNYYLNSQRCF